MWQAWRSARRPSFVVWSGTVTTTLAGLWSYLDSAPYLVKLQYSLLRKVATICSMFSLYITPLSSLYSTYSFSLLRIIDVIENFSSILIFASSFYAWRPRKHVGKSYVYYKFLFIWLIAAIPIMRSVSTFFDQATQTGVSNLPSWFGTITISVDYDIIIAMMAVRDPRSMAHILWLLAIIYLIFLLYN